MGIGLELTELAIDLELHDVLEIEGNNLLPYLIVKQCAIFYNGHHPYKLIIPHLSRESETHAYIHPLITDIDKDTF